MHPRQAIREAAATALMGIVVTPGTPPVTTYATAAGPRVFETRLAPWRTVELPAIAVYTEDESVDQPSAESAPRELKRVTQLAIEAGVRVADLTENVDDSLDDIALEIERAMHADDSLAGTASDAVLSSTEMGVRLDGDRPMGMIRLVYNVTYFTYAPYAADQPLDDFERSTVVHDLAGEVHPGNQASDAFEIPEE